MTHPRQIRGIAGERQEVLDAGLPDHHGDVPPLVAGTDEVPPSVSEQADGSTSGGKERQRVIDVEVVGGAAADRLVRRVLRVVGVVRPWPQPEQIEHEERARNSSTQQHAGALVSGCLLYTSDAADEEDSVDLGGRRIIKKK